MEDLEIKLAEIEQTITKARKGYEHSIKMLTCEGSKELVTPTVQLAAAAYNASEATYRQGELIIDLLKGLYK